MDKARIQSPTQQGSGVKCVTFWYHMYGATVGSLNVYVTGDANLGQSVWRKVGTQGNVWKQAQVDVNLGSSSRSYMVRWMMQIDSRLDLYCTLIVIIPLCGERRGPRGTCGNRRKSTSTWDLALAHTWYVG